nr:hypothetical protein CFP56_25911 [Quercus suber]
MREKFLSLHSVVSAQSLMYQSVALSLQPFVLHEPQRVQLETQAWGDMLPKRLLARLGSGRVTEIIHDARLPDLSVELLLASTHHYVFWRSAPTSTALVLLLMQGVIVGLGAATALCLALCRLHPFHQRAFRSAQGQHIPRMSMA